MPKLIDADAVSRWIGIASDFEAGSDYASGLLAAYQAVDGHVQDQPDASEPLRARIKELEAQKDDAYLERNTCVAAMARMAMALGLRAVRTKTAIEGWSEDWHGCIYIEFPTFQASWHYHDSQAYLFEFLPEEENQWDGHTTEEKYANLRERMVGL